MRLPLKVGLSGVPGLRPASPSHHDLYVFGLPRFLPIESRASRCGAPCEPAGLACRRPQPDRRSVRLGSGTGDRLAGGILPRSGIMNRHQPDFSPPTASPLGGRRLSGGIISDVANYIRREFEIMWLGNTKFAFSLTIAWRRNWRRRETAFGKAREG